MAVPGLVAAMALTAVVLVPLAKGLHFVEGFGLAHGLVFGALIAATDPVAVVGLFKSLGAPKRLATLVEGESLVNDGTAAVLFSLVFAAVASGGAFSPAAAALDFVRVVGLGGPLWAPELEYAFAEGHAVELELPMEGGRLHAFKLGVQGTFGQSRRIGALHGWQGLAEYVPAEKGWLGSLTHVGALRFNPRWSALTIVGAQYDRNPVADERALRFVANASAFAEASARLTWGLEGNLRVGGPGRVDWQVTPQAHVQLWPKWRLQLGFGASGREGRANLIGATRLVAEL